MSRRILRTSISAFFVLAKCKATGGIASGNEVNVLGNPSIASEYRWPPRFGASGSLDVEWKPSRTVRRLSQRLHRKRRPNGTESRVSRCDWECDIQELKVHDVEGLSVTAALPHNQVKVITTGKNSEEWRGHSSTLADQSPVRNMWLWGLTHARWTDPPPAALPEGVNTMPPMDWSGIAVAINPPRQSEKPSCGVIRSSTFPPLRGRTDPCLPILVSGLIRSPTPPILREWTNPCVGHQADSGTPAEMRVAQRPIKRRGLFRVVSSGPAIRWSGKLAKVTTVYKETEVLSGIDYPLEICAKRAFNIHCVMRRLAPKRDPSGKLLRLNGLANEEHKLEYAVAYQLLRRIEADAAGSFFAFRVPVLSVVRDRTQRVALWTRYASTLWSRLVYDKIYGKLWR
ncbi:hypothetical protein B0H11DRAFT_1919668 [Mycena galericulata]|nr:hypothetical protein B0H11DRAFT_1919668 [Mycena galericulata]